MLYYYKSHPVLYTTSLLSHEHIALQAITSSADSIKEQNNTYGAWRHKFVVIRPMKVSPARRATRWVTPPWVQTSATWVWPYSWPNWIKSSAWWRAHRWQETVTTPWPANWRRYPSPTTKDRVIGTNNHPIATRTREQWRWPETTEWVDTERIEVTTTDLERVPRWKTSRLAERALRSMRR